jgi:exodeoxyribonuclease VII small subunit
VKDDVAKGKAAKDIAAKGSTAKSNPTQATYAQIVARLESLVQAMEAGELPLEESLETFAEGVQLIKQGEKILAEADQRVEQLLASGEIAPLCLE